MYLNPAAGKKFVMLCSIFLFAFVGALSAEPVSEATARLAAARYAATVSPLRSKPEITLVYTGTDNASPATGLRTNSDPLLYIYNVGKESGFVIVAGDDKAFPILGYAGSGSFGTEQMPDNLAYWLTFYEDETAYARRTNEYAASDEIAQQWQALLSGEQTDAAASEYVLETALWDQQSPYNYFCPMDGNTRSVAGCVATAMAIVMHYHQWPEKGAGSNRYTMKNGKRLNESFNVAYDWGNMRSTYPMFGWSTNERNAVARLIYHCGVAANMEYGSSSSGAFSPNMQKAVVTNFGYDEGAYLAYRDLYSDNEWNNLIRSELDDSRPVIYTGENPTTSSGHMFVIDGYGEDDYFHVNWGWSGMSNGFYRLSGLNPSSAGTGGTTEGNGYSRQQDALIGMQKPVKGSIPRYEVFFMEADPPEGVQPGAFGLYTDVDNIIKDQPFNLYYAYVYNYGYHSFPGPFAFFLEDKAGNVKDTLHIIDVEEMGGELPPSNIMWGDEGIPLTITTNVEAGDRIRMHYYTKDYGWTPLRGEPGIILELPVFANDLATTLASLQVQPSGITVSSGRTDTEFIIRSKSNAAVLGVTLYDLSGHILKEERFRSGDSQVTFSLSSREAGVYILSVNTTEGNSRHKVINR